MIRSFRTVPDFYDYSYRLFRPVLFRMDPERAHRLTLALLKHAPHFGRDSDPPELRTSIFGLSFSNPIGLAAGLDKDGMAVHAWQIMGFGFAEIGTVTPRPQSGNPRPRVWRIDQHHALINRLGFPSGGMDRVAGRLAKHAKTSRTRIGVNLGPNRATPPERVPEDYAALIRGMAAVSDFVVINLSSPNTLRLRDFQAPDQMRRVIQAIRGACAETRVLPPLLIKIAPDLEKMMLAEICAATVELELAGIVATNTSLDHAALGVASGPDGGLSGNPLKLRSRETVAAIYQFTRGRIPIIGVGGIASAEDAYGHLKAGASLVELYTGLIFHGPGLVGRIKTGLLDLMRQDGFHTIRQAVGRGGA